MINIKDAAKYFLTKVDRESGDEMTHLKLQKICYYAQAWHLAVENKPLFNTEFKAWAHGPVSVELWSEYKTYKWHPIPEPHDFDENAIDPNYREFLDEIWELYGKYTAKYLENLTHQELPWQEARKGLSDGEISNFPISNETMKEYYKQFLIDE